MKIVRGWEIEIAFIENVLEKSSLDVTQMIWKEADWLICMNSLLLIY